ncbi:DUF2254 domain-containing protein [Persicimonas caeni]|uniref:DUF2254 domain-containing protein n=1 Tax=Persicimonas caeni TaxID=2292766 RepID=A0A4Y6PWE6_PERCE|nr:DUF2254 domain-containing protein [Persicimonas caeni]QDG52550.1 DUF2254 domain-containing protein [Persicimonas caeni]QED33772.1 DUF2254 domain-containing protein [Persicimonas caeni]
MKPRELSFWIKIRESMWFLPSVLVFGGLVLAPVMIWIDANFGPQIDEILPFAYDAGAPGARVILGTIAGAMATVVGIAFSITIVVLQLAAGQYSPRVITTFRRDRGQQVVLGTYLATFIYALLVVRQVEGPFEGDDAFIPGLSMLVALGLAVLCLGMLVYFVHHTSEQLRVSDISRRIHEDLLDIGEHLYPEGIGESHESELEDRDLVAQLKGSERPSALIRSSESGYLRQVDTDQVESLADDSVEAIRICPRIGEFVVKRGPLVELYFDSELSCDDFEDLEKDARSAFLIGPRPTVAQNPELGIQQLVDIALRALSPGINDPTTAEQVLAQLGDWIARLAHQDFPREVRLVNGRTVVAPRPSFEDHLREAFEQIRRVAAPQVHVLHSLLDVYTRIIETEPPDDRLRPLRHQVEAVARLATEENVPEPHERQDLVDHANQILAQLPPDQ